jgi:nucleoside 2-deoxyribosyltransferase
LGPIVKAYVAGPLFDEGERWWIEKVEQVVVEAGFTTFLPHRDNPTKDESNVAEIFANDRRGIDECDVVVASLNGITTDDGTAWELGYAFARGKPIVGLYTDWRCRFDHEVVNLMIECSLTALVRSIDDLPGALQPWRAGAAPTQ